MPGKRFISIKELSEYLGVKVNTLYSWVSMKKIPYTKMGGLVRFDLKKIDEWVKNREVKPFKWD
ncbi:MAG: helix-turn-helix domain-containing protein [Candidatus Omnitrophota bacterium]